MIVTFVEESNSHRVGTGRFEILIKVFNEKVKFKRKVGSLEAT